eukprot:g11424.t1
MINAAAPSDLYSWKVLFPDKTVAFYDHVEVDARYLPILEVARRRWRIRQTKTFALLDKFQRFAEKAGLVPSTLLDDVKTASVKTVTNLKETSVLKDKVQDTILQIGSSSPLPAISEQGNGRPSQEEGTSGPTPHGVLSELESAFDSCEESASSSSSRTSSKVGPRGAGQEAGTGAAKESEEVDDVDEREGLQKRTAGSGEAVGADETNQTLNEVQTEEDRAELRDQMRRLKSDLNAEINNVGSAISSEFGGIATKVHDGIGKMTEEIKNDEEVQQLAKQATGAATRVKDAVTSTFENFDDTKVGGSLKAGSDRLLGTLQKLGGGLNISSHLDGALKEHIPPNKALFSMREALQTTTEKWIEAFAKPEHSALELLEAWENKAQNLDYLDHLDLPTFSKQILTTLENIDVTRVFDKAEETFDSLLDHDRRNVLLNQILDAAIDLLMGLLPNIRIAELGGESEDLIYELENLDLAGFKLKKECVKLELNTKPGDPRLLDFHLWDMSCQIQDLRFKYKQKKFPFLRGHGLAFAFAGAVSLRLCFDVKWEQDVGWHPELVMSKAEMLIGELKIHVEETRFAWLYNILSRLFASLIQTIVVAKIQEALTKHVDQFSQTLSVVLGHEMVRPFVDSLRPREGAIGAEAAVEGEQGHRDIALRSHPLLVFLLERAATTPGNTFGVSCEKHGMEF